MILKCPKCNGMMKVDENVIPKTESFKVRCPHCKEIDTVSYPGPATPMADTPAEVTTTAPESSAPLTHIREPDVGASHEAPEGTEPSLPSDAFGRFRFPAEKDTDEKPKKRMSSSTRILVWAGVSLAVVVFFALLVNLVLPGPTSQKPDLGFVPPAMESPSGSAPGEKAGKPR